MIRVFLECLTLFFIPTVIYVAFAVLTRRPDTTVLTIVSRAPVLTLSVLGACIVTGVLGYFGNVGDGKPGQTYEPAVVKDGKVIPGHMR